MVLARPQPGKQLRRAQRCPDDRVLDRYRQHAQPPAGPGSRGTGPDGGGARNARTRSSSCASRLHRPPTSVARMHSLCPPQATAPHKWRVCASAANRATPAVCSALGCGTPSLVTGPTSVASQHNARPCGEAPCTTGGPMPAPGAEVCVSHCWGTTCLSGPTASRHTAIHARSTNLARFAK